MNKNEEAKPKRKWECHRMSESEKRVIVKEYHLEGISQRVVAKRHGTAQTTVSENLRSFAAENENSALFMGKDITISESRHLT